LCSPGAYVEPPITHCVPHCPLAQVCPLPQGVPSMRLDQPLVVFDVSHFWHGSFGLIASGA
jgi:hypothetical protein